MLATWLLRGKSASHVLSGSGICVGLALDVPLTRKPSNNFYFRSSSMLSMTHSLLEFLDIATLHLVTRLVIGEVYLSFPVWRTTFLVMHIEIDWSHCCALLCTTALRRRHLLMLAHAVRSDCSACVLWTCMRLLWTSLKSLMWDTRAFLRYIHWDKVVWWPGMDNDIAQTVQHCTSCRQQQSYLQRPYYIPGNGQTGPGFAYI